MKLNIPKKKNILQIDLQPHRLTWYQHLNPIKYSSIYLFSKAPRNIKGHSHQESTSIISNITTMLIDGASFTKKMEDWESTLANTKAHNTNSK